MYPRLSECQKIKIKSYLSADGVRGRVPPDERANEGDLNLEGDLMGVAAALPLILVGVFIIHSSLAEPTELPELPVGSNFFRGVPPPPEAVVKNMPPNFDLSEAPSVGPRLEVFTEVFRLSDWSDVSSLLDDIIKSLSIPDRFGLLMMMVFRLRTR